jgi:hypothetical protein
MINHVNNILLIIIECESLQHCRVLADNGFTRDQINEVLARCIPEWEKWRAETLAEFVRWANEPEAPSHALQ